MLSASLGAIRDDSEGAEGRGECFACLGSRCVAFSPSTLAHQPSSSSGMGEGEMLQVFRNLLGTVVEGGGSERI